MTASNMKTFSVDPRFLAEFSQYWEDWGRRKINRSARIVNLVIQEGRRENQGTMDAHLQKQAAEDEKNEKIDQEFLLIQRHPPRKLKEMYNLEQLKKIRYQRVLEVYDIDEAMELIEGYGIREKERIRRGTELLMKHSEHEGMDDQTARLIARGQVMDELHEEKNNIHSNDVHEKFHKRDAERSGNPLGYYSENRNCFHCLVEYSNLKREQEIKEKEKKEKEVSMPKS
jgi:hypothetical protein